jgi:8-oxo-dGTP pyrophosphatase MutT (NUDIX family)
LCFFVRFVADPVRVEVDASFTDHFVSVGALVGPDGLTHAGGVVFRAAEAGPEILLVTASRPPYDWVYPKGHIESGERPEDTAVREVREEAGVTAEIVEALEDVTLTIRGERQVIRFFLMRAVSDGPADEGRQTIWLPGPAAAARLAFPEARRTLAKAVEALGGRGPG